MRESCRGAVIRAAPREALRTKTTHAIEKYGNFLRFSTRCFSELLRASRRLLRRRRSGLELASGQQVETLMNTSSANGIRTRVPALRGQCPRPLDDSAVKEGRETSPRVPGAQPESFPNVEAERGGDQSAGSNATVGSMRVCSRRRRERAWRSSMSFLIELSNFAMRA